MLRTGGIIKLMLFSIRQFALCYSRASESVTKNALDALIVTTSLMSNLSSVSWLQLLVSAAVTVLSGSYLFIQ